MSKKKRGGRKPNFSQIAIIVLVSGAVIIGGLALLRPLISNAGTGLRNSDSAFSLPAHVGQTAPTFTAVGVDGQPYKVTPGDGRSKAIVFYMGFQ